ncbi:hypothetical protein Q9Q94_12055 [Uliginosibacterium sp. 31-16]|uniref:hypothetical protein n=1 Tax=Uliginosibacterium sp. 31-16 TaxID=3068315 RepID=UPI00273F7D83|nr:hypothetical protein [Uliginosibacterium sp. 31-16]MDP5240266.1 hypothetical protein [Uliginosibacterium sp. 31-16]
MRQLALFTCIAIMLGGCATPIKRTPEQQQAINARQAQAMAHLGHRIVLVQSMQNFPAPFQELELDYSGLRYFMKDAIKPHSAYSTYNCMGGFTKEDGALINCKFNDGVHVTASINIEQVQQERTIKTGKIFTREATLKKGQLLINIIASPGFDYYIGEFKEPQVTPEPVPYPSASAPV